MRDHSIEDQALALAGVLQACYLVDGIARQGQLQRSKTEALLASVFVTNPGSIKDVYPEIGMLQDGLQALKDLLGRSKGQNTHIIRYAMGLLYLESKLSKRTDMLQVIGQRLEQIERQVTLFDIGHPSVRAALADLYQDTLSKFSFRIHVIGEPTHLKQEGQAETIRALLLAGIRSAILWRQVGGRRWKLLFNKKPLSQAAQQWLKLPQDQT